MDIKSETINPNKAK